MAIEYVNRITIKKDGVYLSLKSSNDSMPYHSTRIPSLSNIYEENGERELKKELIRMFTDYCVPKGNHHSVLPFKNLHNRISFQKAFMTMREKEDEAWKELSHEDKQTRFKELKTPAMYHYLDYSKKLNDEFLETACDILGESYGIQK